MKRLFLAVVLAALACVGFSQVGAQSTQVTFDGGAINVQYVNDGYKGSAAIKINDLGFNNVMGVKGLSLNALVVNPYVDASQNSYFGLLLNYRLYSTDKVFVNVGVGAKGLDITSLLRNGNFNGFGFNDSRQWLWSIGVGFKL